MKNVNKLNDEPPSELSYVIGAIFSDCCKYYHNYNRNRMIALSVKDKNLAETFRQCLAKVLNKEGPYKSYYRNDGFWVIETCSTFTYRFLKKLLRRAKTIH